jgi:hypothetical protein
LARHDGGSAAGRGLVTGLLIYNAAVLALVLSGSFGSLGALLSMVLLMHGVMAILGMALLRIGR